VFYCFEEGQIFLAAGQHFACSGGQGCALGWGCRNQSELAGTGCAQQGPAPASPHSAAGPLGTHTRCTCPSRAKALVTVGTSNTAGIELGPQTVRKDSSTAF